MNNEYDVFGRKVMSGDEFRELKRWGVNPMRVTSKSNIRWGWIILTCCVVSVVWILVFGSPQFR